ncbi:MAG TPA: FecR domain-containing protein [Steroidobacteraceae bacterium]|nr:FecR domain-containing protein [Steroidobacteraceae bacterium]
MNPFFESEGDVIEREAARWLAARDAGATSPAQTAELERWLETDIRHRVAYRRLETNWNRVAKLKDLRPLDRELDADLLKPPAPRRWHLAAAAALVLLAGGAFWFHQRLDGWQTYETSIGVFSRIVLEDGSVVDLNTNSAVRVRLGDARREIRLMRGEGRFQVAHDKSRPFVVAAADAAVRAVGTQFTVRLRDASRVEVVVSEGKVAIAAPRGDAPSLAAGEAALVAPDHVSVTQVPPQQLERRLAWTAGRLEFRGESLDEAVAEFNRYNLRQIRLASPTLGSLRVGGTFKATDPESFAAALASTFKLRVAPAGAGAIVLSPP